MKRRQHFENKEEIKNKKKQRRKRLFLVIFMIIIALLVVVGFFAAPLIGAYMQSYNDIKGTKNNNILDNYYGILVVGTDKGANKDSDGHTDSLTYIAVNKVTKKSYLLPIYRDAYVKIACLENENDNVNRIEKKYGTSCLIDSVSQFLKLDIDYFVETNVDGFLQVATDLGGITINPQETFCSNYGNDKVNYCFKKGEKKAMSANELLAYARYRGGSNGELRANRNTEILKGLQETCKGDLIQCYYKILPNLSTAIKHNIPAFDTLFVSEALINAQNENLGTLKGTNFQDKDGWHQRVNKQDLEEKIQKIQNDVMK